MTDILEVNDDGDEGEDSGYGTPADYATQGAAGHLAASVNIRAERELKLNEVGLERPASAVGGEIASPSVHRVTAADVARPSTAKPTMQVVMDDEDPDAPDIEQAVENIEKIRADHREETLIAEVCDKISKLDIRRLVSMFLPGLGFPSHIHMPENYFDECVGSVKLLTSAPDSPILRNWIRFAKSCKNRVWSVPALANFIAVGLTLAVFGGRITEEQPSQ